MAVLPLRSPAMRRVPSIGQHYGLHGRPALFTNAEVTAALVTGGSSAALVNGWFGGLLTGINMALPETFDVAPFLASRFVPDLVLAEGKGDPEQPLHESAAKVIERLLPARARSASEAVTLVEGARRVTLRSDTLRYVQDALIRRGLMVPPRVDGCDSPELRSALRAFQARTGLEVTGLPDPDTLLALLRGG